MHPLPIALRLAAVGLAVASCAISQIHTVRAGSSALRVAHDADGIRFVSLDHAGVPVYWFRQGQLALGDSPDDIWHVQFWDPSRSGPLKRVVPSTSGARFSVYLGQDLISATWRGCRANAAESFDFELLIRPHADGDAIAMECRVTMHESPSTLGVFRVRCPILYLEPLSTNPTEERLVLATRHGVVMPTPRGNGAGNVVVEAVGIDPHAVSPVYPAGLDRQSMQFSAYYASQPGQTETHAMFLGTRDVHGYEKHIRWLRRGGPVDAVGFHTEARYLEYFHQFVPVDGALADNGGRPEFRSPYPFVIAALDSEGRDDRWFDAAAFYRDWIERAQPYWLGSPLRTRTPNHLTRAYSVAGAVPPSIPRPCGDQNWNDAAIDTSKCATSPIWEFASRASWTDQLDDLKSRFFPAGSTKVVHRTDGWAYSDIGAGWTGQWFEPGFLGSAPGFTELVNHAPTQHPFLHYFFPRIVFTQAQLYPALDGAGAFVADVFGGRLVESTSRTICEPHQPCDPNAPSQPNVIPPTATSPGFPFNDQAHVLCYSQQAAIDYSIGTMAWVASQAGSAGVYLDAFPVVDSWQQCHHPGHGHPVGGGTWAAEALQDYLLQVKSQLVFHDAQSVIVCENANELNTWLMDGAHVENPFERAEDGVQYFEPIPLFDTVYHEYRNNYSLVAIAHSDAAHTRSDYAGFRHGFAGDLYQGSMFRSTVTLPNSSPEFPQVRRLDDWFTVPHLVSASTQWREHFEFGRDLIAQIDALGPLADMWHWGRRCRDPLVATTGQFPLPNNPGQQPYLDQPWIVAVAFRDEPTVSRTLVLVANWTSVADGAPATAPLSITFDPDELEIPATFKVEEYDATGTATTLVTGQSAAWTLSDTIAERSVRAFVVSPG